MHAPFFTEKTTYTIIISIKTEDISISNSIYVFYIARVRVSVSFIGSEIVRV